MPLVYEEDRPQFYEESHVISTIQQGQVLTKVSLPARAQPLVPIKPKEQVTYTTEKKLAAQFISATLQPYIEIEKIEQPKQFDETVSTIFQQRPVTTEQRPEKSYETVVSRIEQGLIRTEVSLPDTKRVKPMVPVQPKEHITYTAEKTLAAQYISKTLHPYIEIEKIEQPKQFDETVSTIFQQRPVTTERRPEQPERC